MVKYNISEIGAYRLAKRRGTQARNHLWIFTHTRTRSYTHAHKFPFSHLECPFEYTGMHSNSSWLFPKSRKM